ncbi:uncharacterized protein PITG_17877 [Phytophthora infestans T30-4]|uniref:Uncharacterized protein n=1 Tax=Phytophthora infestans (strain T30-4) TaxID=403677 RepID=D0NWX0_PHYIT|nr:uncharacterized protein PITG_17877 [Phytophthora infestans T30-4]EEY67557.1 hypothetical protein PITG_17877 [Phytophthora infestans T30-4]|eukprot:XP_002896416.1 hypothetical protein PITG_17877 [Phytophthora infestans T30-4]
MITQSSPFPVGCFVWIPWRRILYLARVEEARDSGSKDVELLVHVHGEQFTKDKWLTVRQDGTAINSPPLRLLQVLPTPFTGIGSFPAVENYVQLLVMDHELVPRIASKCTSENVAVPTLVGVVVKVLPARDASLVDVAYPSKLETHTQWQRVQIGNGYVRQSLYKSFYLTY